MTLCVRYAGQCLASPLYRAHNILSATHTHTNEIVYYAKDAEKNISKLFSPISYKIIGRFLFIVLYLLLQHHHYVVINGKETHSSTECYCSPPSVLCARPFAFITLVLFTPVH